MKNFRITAMDHIVLNTPDVERSLAIYEGVLGLPGERLAEFRRGEVGFPSVRISADTLIDLFPSKEPIAADNGGLNLNHFCLVVELEDFGAFVEGLKQQGVKVLQEPVSRWGARGRATSVYVLDPDGNQVEIRAY
jgi:catechol 2,3-dioxygenase-like lactoylglutathione lyase family enzyme